MPRGSGARICPDYGNRCWRCSQSNRGKERRHIPSGDRPAFWRRLIGADPSSNSAFNNRGPAKHAARPSAGLEMVIVALVCGQVHPQGVLSPQPAPTSRKLSKQLYWGGREALMSLADIRRGHPFGRSLVLPHVAQNHCCLALGICE